MDSERHGCIFYRCSHTVQSLKDCIGYRRQTVKDYRNCTDRQHISRCLPRVTIQELHDWGCDHNISHKTWDRNQHGKPNRQLDLFVNLFSVSHRYCRCQTWDHRCSQRIGHSQRHINQRVIFSGKDSQQCYIFGFCITLSCHNMAEE